MPLRTYQTDHTYDGPRYERNEYDSRDWLHRVIKETGERLKEANPFKDEEPPSWTDPDDDSEDWTPFHECPECKAPKGEQCIGKKGQPRRTAHENRGFTMKPPPQARRVKGRTYGDKDHISEKALADLRAALGVEKGEWSELLAKVQHTRARLKAKPRPDTPASSPDPDNPLAEPRWAKENGTYRCAHCDHVSTVEDRTYFIDQEDEKACPKCGSHDIFPWGTPEAEQEWNDAIRLNEAYRARANEHPGQPYFQRVVLLENKTLGIVEGPHDNGIPTRPITGLSAVKVRIATKVIPCLLAEIRLPSPEELNEGLKGLDPGWREDLLGAYHAFDWERKPARHG